jgi:4-diphosphocytidyl-2-C-methyl-D-erythritol kinase
MTIASGALIVPAPAKINLFLHVTGRRADGYHTLESLLALVDWCDTVELVRRDDGAIVRSRDVPGVPESDDLTLAAARALRDATGTRQGVAIAIDKRIPQGAGLGGGSSDAASVLLALNRLWELRLPRSELAAIGVALGADVPFFVGENERVFRELRSKRSRGRYVGPISRSGA